MKRGKITLGSDSSNLADAVNQQAQPGAKAGNSNIDEIQITNSKSMSRRYVAMTKEKTETGYTLPFHIFTRLDKESQESFLQEVVYQSNLIEGIKDYWVQTVSADNPGEWDKLIGHYKALDYIVNNFENKELDSKEIKKLHYEVMHELLDNSGEYRGSKMYICRIFGDTGKMHYRSVPKAIKTLESKIKKLNKKTSKKKEKRMQDVWDIHHEFETIHPFEDGNGRTGRLLLNWLSLKHLGEFNVVLAEKRQDYYLMIREYEERFRQQNPKIPFYKDITRKINII